MHYVWSWDTDCFDYIHYHRLRQRSGRKSTKIHTWITRKGNIIIFWGGAYDLRSALRVWSVVWRWAESCTVQYCIVLYSTGQYKTLLSVRPQTKPLGQIVDRMHLLRKGLYFPFLVIYSYMYVCWFSSTTLSKSMIVDVIKTVRVSGPNVIHWGVTLCYETSLSGYR